jgi:hypothetical protein
VVVGSSPTSSVQEKKGKNMEEGFFVSYDFVSVMSFLIIGFILIWTLVSHKVRLDKIYEDIYEHEYKYGQHHYYRKFLKEDDLWELNSDVKEIKRRIEEYDKEVGGE